MEISNDYISDCAENYLSSFLTQERIATDIPKHEKRELWDGNILVYKNKSRTKDGLERIPLQLKGTVQDFNGKFSIEKTSLNAFKKEQGAMFFVVKFDNGDAFDKNKATVYFSSLTKPVIDKYLHQMGENNSISVSFEELKSCNILKECRLFLYHREMLNNHETIEVSDLDKIESVSIALFDSEDDSDMLFKKDTIGLAKIKGREKEKIIYITNFKHVDSIIAPVIVNNIKFYDNYAVVHKDSIADYLFGESIQLSIPEKNGDILPDGSIHITLKSLNSLNKCLEQLNFVEALLVSKEVICGNRKINFITDTNHHDYKALKEEVLIKKETFNKIKAFANAFDIKDFNINEISDTDYYFMLSCLQNKIEFDGDLPRFARYKLANKIIFLAFEKSEKNQYFISNAFDMLTNNVSVIEKNKKYSAPLLLQIPEVVYETSKNINFDKISQAIEYISLKTSDEQNLSTIFVLKMINCYDKTKNKQYLNEALQMCEKIKTFNYNVGLINQIQIKKRLNINIAQDLDSLAECLDKCTSNKEIDKLFRCCAHILLENKYEAQRAIKKLTPKQLDMFKSWPIYKLYTDSIYLQSSEPSQT